MKKIDKKTIFYITVTTLVVVGLIVAIFWRVQTIQESKLLKEVILQDEGVINLQDGSIINMPPVNGLPGDTPITDTGEVVPNQGELGEYERLLNELRIDGIDAELRELDAIVN